VEPAELDRLVRSARTSLGADDSRSAELDPDEFHPGRKPDSTAAARADEDLRHLAALLLPADLVEHLPAGTPIVVVPYGALGLVPFAAMEINGPKPSPRSHSSTTLGARHPVSYAPSFAALRATVARPPVLVASRGKAPAFAATHASGSAQHVAKQSTLV